MYQIACDDMILHDLRLSDEYRVIDPVCHMALNKAGSFTFKIAPNHPFYDDIKKLSSVINITQDGEWIFTGRVVNDEKDFRNIKTIQCEGELSYLVDSNQRLAEYHNISVTDYFTNIINKHNAMVDDSKKFNIGTVTVVDSNDSLYRYSNYENSWKTIEDKLINRLGGYIRVRHEPEGRFIDYITDYEHYNTQTINFGKNLLNLTRYVKGDDIATAIIPLGAEIESELETSSAVKERLSIASINNDIDYVYDQDAVNLYGWVFDTVIFNDVTLPENLLRKGQEELTRRKLLSIRLELNAIDLHLVDVDIEKIRLGDKVKVISEPHGINEYMTVSSMELHISDPAANSISLGYTTSALTDITNNSIANKVISIFNDFGMASDISILKQEVRENASEIARTTEDILLRVASDYSSKSETNQIKESLSTQLLQNSKSFTMQFNTIRSETETIKGILTSNQELLEEYIRFEGALIELGKTGNSFVARLSNDKLSFLQDNIEIAYISNNKLYITDGEIKNKLTIGNPVNGFFDFIPRDNGNLSLKWRSQ